jgi:hypothetical protein
MVKFVLRIEDILFEQVRQFARSEGHSINYYINEAVEKAAERSLLAVKPFVNVKVQPGQDIIVQQRNKAGRFTKKA